MKKNNIIFINTENIEGLKERLEETCNILNENHKKVLGFSPNLSWQITFYESFYNDSNRGANNDINSKTYNILKNAMQESTPFFSEHMVDDYYKKLIDYLHNNTYILKGGMYYKDSTTDTEENREKNLKEVSRSIGYIFNWNGWDFMLVAEKYIEFNDGEFNINTQKLEEFIEANTYKTSNKNQQKVLELLESINDLSSEIKSNGGNEHFMDLLFNTYTGEFIKSLDLVNYLKSIE